MILLANLNRENLITVDMKNATISNTAGNMTFYITDKKTSNIFCKLAINESESNDFAEDDDFIPIENALDYKITLRVVKPNHEPKELEFTLLNEKQAIFMVDLPDDYKDRAGTYKCELLIESNTEKESGAVIEPEAVTTNSFTYTVNKSVFNDLDNIIDDGSDNPLINILATKEYVEDLILVIDKQYITADDFPMGSSTCKLTGTIVINGTSGGDLTNFSNQLVYAQKVKGIGGLNFLNICTMDNKYFRFDFNESSVKLYEYEYITKEYMAEELENLTQGIATVAYVDESIAAIPDTDLLINYSTESDVRNMIQRYNDTIVAQDFASKSYVNSMMLSMDQKIEKAGYTTESYVNEEIVKLSTNIGNILTNSYAPTTYVNDRLLELRTDFANSFAPMSYVNSEVTRVDDKVKAINWELANYPKFSYVDPKFSSINSRINELVSKPYATKEELDELENDVLEFRSTTLDYFYDHQGQIDWIMEDWAKKEYVDQKISEAQIGGGEGGDIDLSAYATKEYVDEAIANIEVSGGGNNNSILTIGNGSEEHIFSYDDIPDSMITDDPESFTQITVLLKNVTVNYIDPNNYVQNSKNYPDNIVTVIAMKPEEGMKAVGIVEFNAINGSRDMMMFAVTPEAIMLMEGFTDELATVNNVAAIYATKTELNNKADKSYVEIYINSALGDIESLLKEI